MGGERCLDSQQAKDEQDQCTDEYASGAPEEDHLIVLLLERLEGVSPHNPRKKVAIDATT